MRVLASYCGVLCRTENDNSKGDDNGWWWQKPGRQKRSIGYGSSGGGTLEGVGGWKSVVSRWLILLPG